MNFSKLVLCVRILETWPDLRPLIQHQAISNDLQQIPLPKWHMDRSFVLARRLGGGKTPGSGIRDPGPGIVSDYIGDAVHAILAYLMLSYAEDRLLLNTAVTCYLCAAGQCSVLIGNCVICCVMRFVCFRVVTYGVWNINFTSKRIKRTTHIKIVWIHWKRGNILIFIYWVAPVCCIF